MYMHVEAAFDSTASSLGLGELLTLLFRLFIQFLLTGLLKLLQVGKEVSVNWLLQVSPQVSLVGVYCCPVEL